MTYILDQKTRGEYLKCCMLEVDSHFPIELHDTCAEFPPKPEALTPHRDWFFWLSSRMRRTKWYDKAWKYNGSNQLVIHLYIHYKIDIHHVFFIIVGLGVKYMKALKVRSFFSKGMV